MIQIRCLRHDELEKWFDFTVHTFSGGHYTGEYRQMFVNHFQNDPWAGTESIFVAANGNDFLSTLRVFRRRIYIAGRIFTAGGIGEVCTEKGSRGMGLSTALLNLAIEYMHKNNMFISTLRTEIPSFYNRLGWECVGMHMKKFRLDSLNVEEEMLNNFDVVPVNWNKDVNIMEAIHNAFAARVDGIFVRKNIEYWKNYVRTEAGEMPVIVKAKTGMPVAYLFIEGSDKECLKVKEFCANPGYEMVFDCALAKTLEMLKCKSTYLMSGDAVESSMYLQSEEKNNLNMVRLNKPISIGDKPVNNTIELKEFFEIKNGFYYFDSDDY